MEDGPEAVIFAIVLVAAALAGFMFLGRCSGRGKPLGPAPDAGIPSLLQAPMPALGSLRDLRGKAVVLEFWATWCDTCRETVPHMNKLREQFRGRPVVFLSVTDEPRAAVEAFLKEHPITGWIGLDEGGRLGNAFGVRGIPQVFLIDREGVILMKISPSYFYASDIERALGERQEQRSAQ